MSVVEAKKLEGQFLDSNSSTLLVDYDADVYWTDGEVKRLLFHFRKGVVPDTMLSDAIVVFKTEALKASSIRGTAGGAATASKISPNVAGVVSEGKYRTKIIFKDGTVSNYYASNKVNSLIAGYYDKPKITDRKAVLRGDMLPCRTTQFTERNFERWSTVLPLMRLADDFYNRHEPEVHADQLHMAGLTPDYQIDGTAFSTLTVNYNWRTACHVDAGDYRDGYSVLFVAEQGSWSGGYLYYPRFNVMVNVREGDILLKDPHQQHCNTPITQQGGDYTRLSFILYYRENMQQCAPSQLRTHTPARPETTGGGKIVVACRRRVQTQPPAKGPSQTGGGPVAGSVLVPVQFANRDISLEMYIRPDTTDIKVIDEVLKTNVYERKKLGFLIEPTDRWLDLGGNIGTFSALVLSRGATVVTCEPEADNLRMLEANLLHNFGSRAGQGGWQIVPAAVTTSEQPAIDLYLCSGDYNKYRHTVHRKRGRRTTSVKNMDIRTLLEGDNFNAIKIDIEGAEIEILETLEPQDYHGINKLVYEYSFDVDPSIPRFLAIIARLREVFTTVHYSKVKEDELEYRHFPAATMVYCLR